MKKIKQAYLPLTAFFLSAFLFFQTGCVSKCDGLQGPVKLEKVSAASAPPAVISNPATLTPPHNFEAFTLDSVLPGSSSTFDPFTFGRPGSPYGPNRLFEPGAAGSTRCGPMELPMSPKFADPGDTQAVLVIVGNGIECIADINHERPGAAVTFSLIAAIFTNPPWTIRSVSATSVTITNGSVTLRFTFSITSTVTTITRVEFL